MKSYEKVGVDRCECYKETILKITPEHPKHTKSFPMKVRHT